MDKLERNRLSTKEARDWLGLPAISPADPSASVMSSSADSADVAGGRGTRGSAVITNMGELIREAGNLVPTPQWDVTPYATLPLPSPRSMVRDDQFARPPVPYAIPTDGEVRHKDRTNHNVSSARVGNQVVPPPSDPFWNPVVPNKSVTPLEFPVGDDGVVRVQPTYPSQVSPTSLWMLASSSPQRPWIDRPALRGHEYKRDKRRGRQQARSGYGLLRVDAGADRGASSDAGSGTPRNKPIDDRRKFLGIRWPSLPPGSCMGRSGGVESSNSVPRAPPVSSKSTSSCALDGGSWGTFGEWVGNGMGGIGDSHDPGDGGGDGRLAISIEGSIEIGKGLGGYTAYRIKVMDRAIGEHWTVLRRFRQFEALHESLLPVLSREPDAAVYALPPKELFGGRHSGVIAKRIKLLKVYLNSLVSCRAAVEHRAMTSFLELDPALRGLGAYARQHGPNCVVKEGHVRVKEWKGPYKFVINILEAGLNVIGWVSAYVIISPGPVFLVYRGTEDDPDKPVWSLPDRRTIGSQVRVRRVDMWGSDLEKDNARYFLVSWENTSFLCQVDSDAALESWTHAIDEDVDLRPMNSEQDRAKVDIELKAKEVWASREDGLWGGL